MAKSAYRGQDATRELIRQKMQECKATILTGNDSAIWNDACDKLAAQMTEEGLHTTAATVMNYKH
jgi:pyruvate-formate lyase-activating enzyme